eukprot:SM009938S25182  [mRNA]  locus=s9938:2:319:- [translate_table: standard]
MDEAALPTAKASQGVATSRTAPLPALLLLFTSFMALRFPAPPPPRSVAYSDLVAALDASGG